MLAGAVLAAAAVVPAPAEADTQTGGIDWSKVAAAMQAGQGLWPGLTQAPAVPADPDADVPWVGRAARLSIVARDWSGSRPVLGAMALTDELRPSQSIRMGVARLRFAEGRVAPFAQLGLGEWRVDAALLPMLPRVHELAAQTGVGFEVSLAPETVLAFETDWTFLHSQDDPDNVTLTHPTLWSTCLAARTRF